MKTFIVLCAVVIALSACVKTPRQPTFDKVAWLDQGWDEKERRWFHHASQGTATFPIPYDWFMELEQPIELTDWYKGFKEGKFSSSKYLQKFGFIPTTGKSDDNPNELPIGFAKTDKVPDPINGGTFTAIGLTCAGCHTSQITYDNTSIRIDGGPAVTNLALLRKALGLALIETAKLPLRHNRFKQAVVKRILRNNPGMPKAKAEANFDKTFKATMIGLNKQIKQNEKMSKKNVEEGFTRLDALNAIGNTVFGNLNPEENFAPTDAPVNYPHLWSTSWFDWVQYDASIMQPMIRNAGEAMGVRAPLQLKPGPNQFWSMVNFQNVYDIETLLAGTKNPQKAKAFTGLKAPKWPEKLLGKIEPELANEGKDLYEGLCVGCHRPAVSSAEFWSDKYWKKITPEGANYYEVEVIPVKMIGTDSAQSLVLGKREINLAGTEISGEVCSVTKGRMDSVQVNAAPKQPFALALGLTVDKTKKFFYDANNIDPARREIMNGERPNCLQANAGYKARPLNGIWATAPFLHNGSVATLYDMLSPVSARAKILYLGYQGFDPKKVGYISVIEDQAKPGDPFLPTTEGLTKVIVSGKDARHGNFNTGHEFNDEKGPGVIGPGLDEAERRALVEYLKTL